MTTRHVALIWMAAIHGPIVHHGDPFVVYFLNHSGLSSSSMSREDPQLKIRLTVELKDRIEAAAKDANRSMNAEIVARLLQSFEGSQSDRHVVLDAQLTDVVSMKISIPVGAMSPGLIEGLKPVLEHMSEQAKTLPPASLREGDDIEEVVHEVPDDSLGIELRRTPKP